MSAKRAKKGDYGAAALRFMDIGDALEEPTKDESEEQPIEGQTAFHGFDPREAPETFKGDETETPIETISEPGAATSEEKLETETPTPIGKDETVQAKPIAKAHSYPGQFDGETEMEYLHRTMARSIDPKHGYFEITDTPEGGTIYTQQKKNKRVQLVMQPEQHAILKEISKATGEKLNGLVTEYVWRGIKDYYEEIERQHDEQKGRTTDK